MEKVWIYPLDRELEAEKLDRLKMDMDAFIEEWNAHGQLLKASCEMPYGRFIVLKVDEEYAEASGCSIDSSVRFLKEMEKKYNISLFDRAKMNYMQDGSVKSCNLNEISSLYTAGHIADDTTIFNTMLTDAGSFDSLWRQPFAESGYARFR